MKHQDRTTPKASRQPRLHQITFCAECEEVIPARAMACYRCGARQTGGGKTMQVIFCEMCGEDYPARAMACFHCGHGNPRNPYHTGHIAR